MTDLPWSILPRMTVGWTSLPGLELTVAGRRGIGADQRMVGLGGKVEIEVLFLLRKYIRQEINKYQKSKYTYGNEVELDTQP
ncbi:MAG: hypothetical protein HQK56_04295 [Deltaproteobacteria bacterium]|nr:hypothetical protein [Deltaproteobacteria bacterium]